MVHGRAIFGPLRAISKVATTAADRAARLVRETLSRPSRPRVRPSLDPRVRRLMLRELRGQAETSRKWIDQLLDAEPPADEVWRIAQAAVGALALCSKILRPQPGSAGQSDSGLVTSEGLVLRGRELRKAVGLRGDAALLDRHIRNSLEHFDERLHAWAKESSAETPLDGPVIRGLQVRIEFADPSPKNVFRFYDNGILRFWDHALDLHVVRAELGQLIQALDSLPADDDAPSGDVPHLYA